MRRCGNEVLMHRASRMSLQVTTSIEFCFVSSLFLSTNFMLNRDKTKQKKGEEEEEREEKSREYLSFVFVYTYTLSFSQCGCTFSNQSMHAHV